MQTFAELTRFIVDEVCRAARERTVLGLCGGQGAGKTTLAHMLVTEFERRGVPATLLSLDDFYLSHAARQQLARSVHPLCATRGVPGTHDIAGLLAAVDAAFGESAFEVPVFDKGRDDRAAPRRVPGGARVVIVEGWCIGARPQAREMLATAVNALEAGEDRDGAWRGWVNDALAGDYRRLGARLDYLVYLDPGAMERIVTFRLQQERGLPAAQRMSRAALERFVAHYERLTRWMQVDVPGRADVAVSVGDGHRILGVRHSDSVQAKASTVTPDDR